MRITQNSNSVCREFFKLATIVSILVLPVQAWAQIDLWPGGHCKAANVNQAAFLSWSQFGVRNPAPIGGPSFFVLCNYGPIEDSKKTNPTFLEIGIHYNHASAQNVSCTFRDIDADGNPNTITNIATYVADPSSASFTCTSKPCDGFIFVDQTASTSAWNAQTLVCALHPQSGINYITNQY